MKKTILLFFMLINISSYCQVLVDLAESKSTTETISEKLKPKLVFKNMIPTAEYTYKIESFTEIVPSFSSSDFSGSTCTQDGTNNEFLKVYSKLGEVDNENKVADLVNKLNAQILVLKKADIKKYAECILSGLELIDKTTKEKQLMFNFEKNQTITVTIERKATVDGKETTIKWVKVFKTTTKKPWLIHYGLTYRPNIITKPDLFFSKKIPNTQDSFTVTKQNGDPYKFWENVSPTIMFTYPFDKKERDIQFGFTGILSSNFSTFSGGVGLSAIIGYNVAVGTGIMFSQKNFLLGDYKEGDVIRTNLTFDQLHKKQWTPEFFFTIGFRFDKNPFSGAATPTPASTPTK